MVVSKNNVFYLVKDFCKVYPRRERPEVLMQVFSVMQEAYLLEPREGFCYKRVQYIKNKLGTGSMLTFSKSGISAVKASSEFFEITDKTEIIIPQTHYDNRTCTKNLSHTVYELHNIVYSYELPHFAMPLKEYKAELKRLNKYSPVMVYE